jgi:hypothetical protein
LYGCCWECGLIYFKNNNLIFINLRGDRMSRALIERGLKGKFFFIGVFVLLLATTLPAAIFAGGMPSTEYRFPIGKTYAIGGGDIVSSNQTGGWNSYYSYFIEVPAGTGNLTVDIYDANIYNATDNSTDEQLGSGWDTNATYTLISPSGATTTFTCPANSNNCGITGATINNAWYTPGTLTIASPAAGHWELRMTIGAGHNVNTFALRARDTGTSRELNMYAQPVDILGVDGALRNTRTSHLYPYITSGCSFISNGWDWDYDTANLYGGGSTNFTSRLGFTQNITVNSLGSVWRSDEITGWNYNVAAADYGLWEADVTISNHNGVSNIITYYLGNYSTTPAATTAPTSRPSSGTFRMYMPTYNNGGTAGVPVKPYVGQTLQWVSGPNPPAVGSTTVLQVQVTVTNPTAYAITFSSSNLVSANVPGGQVVYFGSSASATQGTITAQPANNGSGLVSWNPGSVAAGATVSMTYNIRVTPTSATSVIVTGTPTASGTTATFVDETGVATFTFGPLCQLTAGPDIPTLATISYFEAYTSHGKVVVEWATSSEINTVGFYLKRLDTSTGHYVPVIDRLLHTAFDNNRAGVYRVVDTGASAGTKATYILTEVEAKGRTRDYGPFVVTAGSRANASPMTTSFNRQSIQIAELKGAIKPARSAAVQAGASQKAKITIQSDGIYAIEASRIGSIFGVSKAQALNWIVDNRLLLSNNGKNVAYLPDPANSRILFYGQGIKSNYTTDNIYWLTMGRGSVMTKSGKGVTPVVRRSASSGPGDSASPETFIYTKHFEEKHIDGSFMADNPDRNYWYWDYVIGGDPDAGARTFNLPISGLSTNGAVTVSVKLLGQSTTSQAEFLLNGQNIGARSLGIENKTVSLPVSTGVLKEGANTLEIRGLSDSMFFIEAIDISYQRYYRAEGDSLTFPAGRTAVTITGFSDSGIRVFDITDPINPKAVNVTITDTSVGFTPSSAGQFIAVSGSGVKGAAGVAGYNGTSNILSGSGADYLVITSEELKAAASTLAAFRKSLGLTTLVVTVEEIMDKLNNGIYSPAVIRSFITNAYKNWSKKPKYVLLAGGGTYDYKDYLGYGGQQVPPIMVASPDGLIPSDNYYVDVNSDHIPEMAIGRLPASTPADLSGMVSKIIAYESMTGGDWVDKALLVADIPDGGGDYNSDVDSLSGVFPARIAVSKLYYSEYPGAYDMNAALLQGINSGAAFISYFGHGGMDRLSQDGILLSADVASMTNSGKLPVMTAMTCLIGNFAVPGFTTLGETLILKRDGGVAALWTSAGMSDDKQALMLDKAFFSAAFDGSVQTVGDLVRGAIKKANLGASDRHLIDAYIILGDPALRVKGTTRPAPITNSNKNMP